MNLLRKTYLYKLLIADRKLFVALMAFIALQLFFTYKGVETLPFVNYGMYSEKMPVCNSQTVYQLTICGQRVNITSLTDCEKDITLNSIQQYDQVKQSNGKEKEEEVIDHRFKGKVSESTVADVKAKLLNSPSAIERYPKWLMKYLADMRMVNSSTLNLSKSTLTYDSKGNISISSPVTIGEYAEQ